jgi:hypothetical protein
MCQRKKLTPVSPAPCHLAQLDLYEVARYTKHAELETEIGICHERVDHQPQLLEI